MTDWRLCRATGKGASVKRRPTYFARFLLLDDSDRGGRGLPRGRAAASGPGLDVLPQQPHGEARAERPVCGPSLDAKEGADGYAELLACCDCEEVRDTAVDSPRCPPWLRAQRAERSEISAIRTREYPSTGSIGQTYDPTEGIYASDLQPGGREEQARFDGNAADEGPPP